MRTGYTTVNVTEMDVGAQELWNSVITQSVSNQSEEIEIGTVLEVFDRSVYLELDHDGFSDRPVASVVVLGTGSLRSGPLLTRTDADTWFSFDDLGISSGGSCWIGRVKKPNQPDRFILTVDQVIDVRFDANFLERSKTNTEPYCDLCAIDRHNEIWNRTQNTIEWAVRSGIDDGLNWLPDLAQNITNEQISHTSGQFEKLASTWKDYLEQPSANNFDITPWKRLIGRGPGATPSGDDIISGVLLTLNYMTEGKKRQKVQDAGLEIVTHAESQTTTVSAALMEQAALGRGSDIANKCLKSLLTTTQEKNRRNAVSELIEIGHTSGADILTGIFITILSISPVAGNS